MAKFVYIPESFDKFYDPIVGSDKSAESLREEVADAVDVPQISGQSLDPYNNLQVGLSRVFERTISELDGAVVPWKKDQMITNGLFATKLTVAVVKAIGTSYQSLARVPQERPRVAHSTHMGLLKLHGIAFADGNTASEETAAYFFGVNPNNPLTMALAVMWFQKHKKDESVQLRSRAFAATERDNGQIDIRPRYKNRPLKKGGDRCPAAGNKVDTSSGQRSALGRLLSIIKEVTVSEIYPKQFEISDPEINLHPASS